MSENSKIKKTGKKCIVYYNLIITSWKVYLAPTLPPLPHILPS